MQKRGKALFIIILTGFFFKVPIGVAASLDQRFSDIILSHHFYKGQNYVYPIPFEPKEVFYHPSAGVEVKWHAETHALRFITKKVGSFGVQVLHPEGHWYSLLIMIYPPEDQALAITLQRLSMRGNFIQSNIHKQKQNTTHRLYGIIYDPRDWILFCSFIQGYGSNLSSEVKLYAPAWVLLQQHLKDRIKQKFGPHIQLRFTHQQLIVTGYVSSDPDKQSLSHYLKQFSPSINLDSLQSNIGFEEQLEIGLEFIEVKEGSGLTFGINHNAHQLQWQVGQTSLSYQSLIQLLIKKGKAKMLSQPNLVVRHHKVAHLHIGGEIPFEIKTRQRLNIVWKKFGIMMEITPHPIDQTLIHLEFKVSVSFPTQSPNTSNHLPTFSIRSINSEVIIPKGQTAILSGMLQELRNLTSSGIPGLSEIPILGHFFKTTDTNTEQTELIIAITPKPYRIQQHWLPGHSRKRLIEHEVKLA